jgi:adenylate kinase family enzyme
LSKPRIHIIGGPGSGKSFAAAKLSKRLDVPTCDLDDLYWDIAAPRYGVRADPAERDRKLAEIVSRDGWIIEGVYYQWLAPSFDVADFIIALMPPLHIRHWRVVRRFLARKLGRIPSKRETVADLWSLLRWSHAYDKDNLARARQFIEGRGRKLIICQTFEDLFAVTDRSDAHA